MRKTVLQETVPHTQAALNYPVGMEYGLVLVGGV
jgi:hypothetical protein